MSEQAVGQDEVNTVVLGEEATVSQHLEALQLHRADTDPKPLPPQQTAAPAQANINRNDKESLETSLE